MSFGWQARRRLTSESFDWLAPRAYHDWSWVDFRRERLPMLWRVATAACAVTVPLVLAIVGGQTTASSAQVAAQSASSPSPQRALLNQYCVG